MTGNEYLQSVRKRIYYVFDRDAVEQELALHLQDSMDDLREQGYSKDEAEQLAVERMGSTKEVGKLLNKEHHPVLGYTWLLSAITLGFFVVFGLYWACHVAYMGIRTATPITIEDSKQVFPVDMELQLPTHSLRLDNICVNEEGEYFLTYRAWKKYSYSRAGWAVDLFSLKDSAGSLFYGGGYRSHVIFGFYGYREFSLPEDGLLYVHAKDGTIVEINLNEVMQNEER